MMCAEVFWNKLLLIYYRWPNWNGEDDLKEDLKFSYSNRCVYIYDLSSEHIVLLLGLNDIR